MASKVKICNRALLRLAQSSITDLTEDTVSARRCNLIYDDVAEDIMALAWPSNTFRATLAQSADAPDWGYAYKYQLPTDPKCLTVLKINEAKPGELDYRIENGYLLTDELTVELLYAGFLSNSESYDNFLKQAIIWSLTAELAYITLASSSAADKIAEKAAKEIKNLLALSGVQGSNDSFSSDSFIDTRY